MKIKWYGKIKDTKSYSGLASGHQKNDYGWDSNLCSQQLETSFEVSAVFQRRTCVRPLCLNSIGRHFFSQTEADPDCDFTMSSIFLNHI